MDECTLNDLLECSVCLERLDTSSKVLPCQHTFCRKCLEEIYSSHKELRCPECRVLVDCKIEELPPNVLLMRILEGMKNANGTRPKRNSLGPSTPTNHRFVPSAVSNNSLIMTSSVHSSPSQPMQASSKLTPFHASSEQARTYVNTKPVLFLPNQPHARAMYDYSSSEPGYLSFKKGDVILLRKKIDSEWCQGDCGGTSGVFPLSYVNVLIPLPMHNPQCKALFDFRRSDDEEGCLTFSKGEVITVIRRVDENWAEGKLGSRIGIFPISFVEMNSVARSLMKLSSNAQPGPSRIAPPTPTSEDVTPLIPTETHQSWTPLINQFPSLSVVQQSHVSHSATPTSLPSVLPTQGASDLASPSSPSSCSSTTTTPNTTSSNSSSPNTSPSSSDSTPTHRSPINRHSFTAFSSQLTPQHYPNQRHSAEVLRDPVSSPQENALELRQSTHQTNSSGLNRHNSHRHRRSTSTDVAHHSLFLPAPYIALFPYKPQKEDELELRKGNMYTVTERCQDGWYKGTSNRTQKSGVFPGNYVAPAKSLPALQAQLRGLGRNQVVVTPSTVAPRTGVSYTRTSTHNGKPQGCSVITSTSTPPELPPRCLSPTPPTTSIPTLWHSDASHTPLTTVSSSSGTPKVSSSIENNTLAANSLGGMVVIGPPNCSILTSPKALDKSKGKMEKRSVSLMKRFTIMKKSKSPPPMSYSMDNPVFEDGSSPPTSSQHRHVHVSKSTGDSSTNAISSNIHHRKSSSLDADANSARKLSKQLAPPIKERFRCIVPYPPNSEIELELQVGDIIYVHKKRDDGWYKGTQQRTGRTGLFPASFVESF
nr:PREDICTED: E3 ubiquitin-protein ligase SH3RF1 isoform X2 [Bemisia tabaci]